MMSAVAVTRRDLSAAGLRRAAACSKDAAAARRMLALALVLEGTARERAAAQCGMERQTLRDWVHRYNAEGLPGLSNKRSPGAAAKLTAEQSAAVAEWVRAGPSLAEDGLFAGGASIWRPRSSGSSACRWPSARLAICCIASVFAGFRSARSTPTRTPKRYRRIKKLCRAGPRRRPGARPRQAARNLVAGRGPGRSARHTDLCLGRQRQPTARSTRPAPPLGLSVWRRVSRSLHRSSARPALRQRRGDDCAPG